ncbi:class I SAM-dependent methyltransferase [Comamonas sp. Y6]|uniref:Class I SAM-dependent methyltransferase n=1 Tax=Comamonas resistens TaxID=3046670 RepID=A0ABY8SSS9_9BURK|nr:class I SAM-dependent methyltransferase [Comamonas resistens]MDL5039213.1 class I SAM-dependent methyltransferase [Comamonas resistens]WHS66008.1 class I SAM-dependent methyltransferase [Comamonas resistens]
MSTLQALYESHQGKVSDKWFSYLKKYEEIFSDFSRKSISLLEIGVSNGGSLEVLAKYFKNASHLVGCDINPGCQALQYEDARISVVVGDANSDATQDKISGISDDINIIIDDGSHRSSDIVKSFARYFPLLSDGGVYVVEDVCCSYWNAFEGGIFHPTSSISFFKSLVDVINHQHWGIEAKRSEILNNFREAYKVTISESVLEKINSIEFCNSLCIIRKKSAELNLIGNRVIAGSVEEVLPGHLSLAGSSMPKVNEDTNAWSVIASK